MGSEDEEHLWIRRSQAGDPEAFGALVKRYQTMVHTLAYRMTGSAADSEDLAQETFIRAYRQLASFRGDARFSSWLGRITIRQCLNWLRRQDRRGRLQSVLEGETRAASGCDDRAGNAESDRRLRVNEALLRLPAEQRAAVALTIQEGLSHAEAASILRCSEATVSWRLFAARLKLRRWLK